MIGHILNAVTRAGAGRTLVVLGHQAPLVRAALPPDVLSVVQEPQLGTGHAVRIALDALPATAEMADDIALILYGDMPLLTPDTLRALVQLHRDERALLTMLSAVVSDPRGYGRVLRDETGRVAGVREQKELTPAEEGIAEINCGVYCASLQWLRQAALQLPQHPDGEYYLPDLVPLALEEGPVGILTTDNADEAQGVNTRVQLAAAEHLVRMRINTTHMLAGVTMVDPATTYIESGVQIGQDTIIHPNTHLRGETRVGEGCEIGPDTELVASTIGDGTRITRSVVEESQIGVRCLVGPFAHLRRNTVLADGVEIGNYAEVKNSRIGSGSVSHHFSYLGDTTVGVDTNVGAGTITCNYDGQHKHPTTIGDNVFIGSGTLLRAPVTLGDNSRTGAGAVVLHDVAAGMTVAGVPARQISAKPRDTVE